MKRLMFSAIDHNRTENGRSFGAVSLGLILIVFLAACGPDIGDDTAAVVNGRPITMAALEKAAGGQGNETGKNESRAVIRDRILEQLIEEELVLDEAERLRIEVTEAELESRVAEIKSDFPNGTFEDTMVRGYVNYDLWRERVRRNLLIRKVTDSVIMNRIRPDPDEWAVFYEKHRRLDPVAARIKVRHITLPEEKQATRIHKQLKAGKDIKTAVKKVLGKKTEFEPGEPVWTRFGRLPGPIAEVLGKTEVGGYSEVVKTEVGYSIFQVVETEEARPPAPEAVLAEVRRLYMEKKGAEVYEEWMNELRAKATIVINPALAARSAGGDNEENKKRGNGV